MKRKCVDEMNKEVDNITDWMISVVLKILILCVIGVLIGLILGGG